MSTTGELIRRAGLFPIVIARATAINGTEYAFAHRHIARDGVIYAPLLANIPEVGESFGIETGLGTGQDLMLVLDNTTPIFGHPTLSACENVNPLLGASVTVEVVYLDPAGAQSSDVDTLFVGILDAPHEVSKKYLRVRGIGQEYAADRRALRR